MNSKITLVILGVALLCSASLTSAASLIGFRNNAREAGEIWVMITFITNEGATDTCEVRVPIANNDRPQEKAARLHRMILADSCMMSMFDSSNVRLDTLPPGTRTSWIRIDDNIAHAEKIKDIKISDDVDVSSLGVNGKSKNKIDWCIHIDGETGETPDDALVEVSINQTTIVATTPMAFKTGDQVEAELAAALVEQGVDARIQGGDLWIGITDYTADDSVGVALGYATTGQGFGDGTYLQCVSVGAIPTLSEWGLIILTALLVGWIGWVIVRRKRVTVST